MRGKHLSPPNGGQRTRRRLREVSPWTLVIFAAVFALVFGLGVAKLLVAVVGVVIGAVATASSKRVQELFERKPDLRLVVGDPDRFDGTVVASSLRPWPVDIERVVAHELEGFRQNADGYEKLLRSSSGLRTVLQQFGSRPSQEDYERAVETFTEKLGPYADALRAWLNDYRAAADLQSRMFELRLAVISGTRGAHAESVTLAIDLPPDVEVVDEWPTVPPPPEPPSYQPPAYRSPFSGLNRLPAIRLPLHDDLSAPPLPAFDWRLTAGGRRAEIKLGDIHHGGRLEVDEPLLLRAPGEGRHLLKWTLYVKSRRHPNDRLALVVPPVPDDRAPFTRLDAIKNYPDVSFVDDRGEVVRSPRTTDPPTAPPPATTDNTLQGRLREMAAHRDWRALGFGEACSEHEQAAGDPDVPDDPDAADATVVAEPDDPAHT